MGTGGGFILVHHYPKHVILKRPSFIKQQCLLLDPHSGNSLGFLSPVYCAAGAIKIKTQIHRLGLHSLLSDFLSACFHVTSECCLLFYLYFKDCSFYFIQNFSCFQQGAGLGTSFTVLPEVELLLFLVQRHLESMCHTLLGLPSALPLLALPWIFLLWIISSRGILPLPKRLNIFQKLAEMKILPYLVFSLIVNTLNVLWFASSHRVFIFMSSKLFLGCV